MLSTCDYIGCFEKLEFTRQNNGYCKKHEKNIVNDPTLISSIFPKHLFKNNIPDQNVYQDMFNKCAAGDHASRDIFNRMMNVLEECQKQIAPTNKSIAATKLFDRMEELKNDIIQINENDNTDHDHNMTQTLSNTDMSDSPTKSSTTTQKLSSKLQQRIRQKRIQSRTNKNSKTNQKVLKKVKRIIRENRSGDKVTEEVEETISSSQKLETLTIFKTEEELELFVEQTTERYETTINEYSKNKELVYSSLMKWFQEIAQERTEENLTKDISMEKLMRMNYSQNQKEIIIYWKLWQALWHDDVSAPPLQYIDYYTIEALADGNRKMFHCAFSSDKLNSKCVKVSVPEILLRAIPAYRDILGAFFIAKFIPYKKIYMKHQRARELYMQSKNEAEVDEALNNMIDEEDTGFSSDLFPEINPRVCYIKVHD